jgi:predicted transcriptional regulator
MRSVSPAEGKKVLGPLEAEVMAHLWKAGKPLSVRELLERVNRRRDDPLAYTTVMTVMSRLAEKQVLRRERQGRGYVYEAVAKDPAEIAVQGVMRDFGEAALAHFVEEARSDPKLLRRLERLMREDR